jgi:hypothetical protein
VVLHLAKFHPKAKLVLWDWNESGCRETAEGAKLLGVEAFSYKVDVTNRVQVDETAKRVLVQIENDRSQMKFISFTWMYCVYIYRFFMKSGRLRYYTIMQELQLMEKLSQFQQKELKRQLRLT